ncbi:GNAT family N-acetyltransferase [Costertonia aggregata]|uniref:GNAT family N-acetyltransferase n=1 Tax=Costertonia aggregata TaxID=343403 RepID=A0A7H9AKD1_9FLAO|nr:GNAT family N-acetyltransferase [Costertonia aggregata]QLG43877.1 GNAT family N-acetyltransferase [Costertonia aggregata]
MIKILQATDEHIELIVPLFDSYRVFYKQKPDKEAAKMFLNERITKGESVIFLALFDDVPCGFIQLYSTFSSVSLQPFYILNDLFVDANHRNKGIGAALLNSAKVHCENTNCKGLALETAIDNPAQKLYEKLGWKRDSHCFHYFWSHFD